MNLRDIASKVRGYIQSKTQDDEGWIRQNKFTPVQEINNRIAYQKQVSPINRAIYTGIETASQPVVKSLANIGALGANVLGNIQMARNKPESALNLYNKALAARQYAGTTGSFDQGTQSGLNTLKTGGLSALQTALTGKGLEYITPANLAVGGLMGGVSNKVGGGDFATGFGQGVGNTPQIMGFVGATNPLLNKLIPKTAGNVAGRVAGAGLNVAQGIGMDIARGTPTTAGSVALDLATGLAGGKTQFETGGIKVKGMTDQVFTQDKNIVNEARQILKFNTDTPDQLDQLRNTMKVLAKKYELTSQPNWNKYTLEKQYEILSNQMDEMAKNWANVSMGIMGGENAVGYKDAESKFSAIFDKKPRFEIDDSNFKLKPVEGGYGNKTFKLDDLIEHKELFKNYPELKNVEVSFIGKGNASVIEQGFKGSTNKNKIEINNVNSMEEAKSTLLHEIQHIIQTKEGFASGGSPTDFIVKRTPSEDIELQNLFLKESKNGLTPEEQARKQSLSGGGIDGILNSYQRLSGEIEARDVQARMNLTPEQRARTQPYTSQGIKPNDFITKFDDKTSNSIKSQLEPKIDTLLEEARKYKSAEEFIKEQPKLFRGGSPLDLSKTTKEGISFAKDVNTADRFNQGLFGSGEGLRGYVIDKNAKILNLEDIPYNLINKFETDETALTDYVLKKGFDGVDIANKYGENEVRIFNPNVIKKEYSNINELTDIWNKANPSQLEPKIEVKQPTVKIKQEPTIKTRANNDQNLLNSQEGRLDMGEQEAPSLQQNKQQLPQSTQPKIKIKVGKTNQTSSGNLPQDILPQTKLSDIEKTVYGTETKLGNTGNKESVGFIGDKLRIVENKANEIVSKGLTSENKAVRGVATLFQDLFGGAGKSQGQLSQKSQFRGGTDYATKIAGDTQNYVYKLLNNDTKSLERIHAVLDPEISKLKIDEGSLNGNEKEALKLIREVSDYINDTNYGLGFISKDLWQQNRGGKYLARAYEVFDYPPEVADFIKNKSIKFDLNPFKKRTEITDWKKDNAITDPAYLISKRLQQTLFNTEVKKYTDWATKSGLISDTQKAGYVQLSDSKAYGEAAGKWIRKDALEDIKGFFVSNDIGQKAYDILNWWDKNPLRRSQKMLKTVFNPAVRLGNRTGNYVFAWLNGINPVSFAKNRSWAKNAINSNDPIYRYATQNGLTGSDVTKADITRISAELKRGVTDKNVLQKINDWAKESYGRVDDVSKIAAFKTWLDRGVSPEEALNRTRRGFQDYNMVGMLYDIGAKVPVLGNPFVRFASESIRIVKNAAIDHPFRLAATLGAWSLFTDVMSRMSGETEKDRKTREGRVGASHLPFTNISTNVMTPYGEVNASRLLGFSSAFTPEDTGKLGSFGTDLSKYAPLQNPLDARNYSNDPVFGPIISLATDKDFRGKSIADPKQNKYTGSLLTPAEQNMNRLGYAARSYLPPSFTDIYNIGAAIQGKENVYGQIKTPAQSILRTYPGIKVEQFGPEEAQATRDRNADYNAYELESIQKQINAVKKQQVEGKITPSEANKRIENLERRKITSQSDRIRTFETSPEAPKDVMERISLATKATVTNPTNALKVVQAIFTEERMRKLSGDTLIFERETNLNKTKEKGDAVDHIIPLSLGGDNSDKNIRYISESANQQKARLETSLARKLANNEITGAEARKQIKNFIESNSEEFIGSSSTKDISSTESTGKIYKITNKDTGKDTEIDLTFPEYPKETGFKEVDKTNKTAYYSKLTKIKTNARKLYEDGQLTAKEYNDILEKVSTSKSKSGSGSTKSKGGKITVKAPKYNIPKISVKFQEAPSVIKLKSAPKIKVTSSNRKYTIKA